MEHDVSQVHGIHEPERGRKIRRGLKRFLGKQALMDDWIVGRVAIMKFSEKGSWRLSCVG
jgi:hypothetical protein